MASPSIDLRPSGQRFTTQTDWITSRHAFSFGTHYDPANVGFGALLVCNEDVVQSATGYEAHPHRDAEIVTWVLSGSLVHEDSYGNRGLVYPGLAQRMTAGSGIVHSERNDAFRFNPQQPPQPVHFVQMWLRPDEPGATPGYAQREVTTAELERDWVPVVSGSHPDAAVQIGTRAATLWVTRLAAGSTRILPEGPRVHGHVVSGQAVVESAGSLEPGDTLRILGGAPLRVTATSAAELLVWQLSD